MIPEKSSHQTPCKYAHLNFGLKQQQNSKFKGAQKNNGIVSW